MIPITKPTLPSYAELEDDLREIIGTGIITNGKYVAEFEQKASEYLDARYVVGVSSCTTGLILALSTLPKGSEVLMPGYTFSATYQAIKWNNLKPILADCDESCNIEPKDAKKKITKNTSAILAVHMYGTPCPIDELEEIARSSGIVLFFDAAHAFGSIYRKRYIGNFGKAEVFSLGPTKTLPCGEGGLIVTNDKEFADKMVLARNHGHTHNSLDCIVPGLNGRLQEISGAIGIHILKRMEQNVTRRNRLAHVYTEKLSKFPGVSFPVVPSDVRSTFKDYSIFIDKEEFGIDRDRLGDELLKRGIVTKQYFYPPIHNLTISSEEFKGLSLPNTLKKSRSVISLPLYSHMPEEEVNFICDAFAEIYRRG